jgi:hypothetical protein
MLHVTNGDSAGGSLKQSGVPGEVMAWRDVLHEGPVPAGVSPEELRPLRARFIADMGWSAYEDALGGLAARDAALADCGAHDEVVLWFEHDLYDQLQLLQILDFFAGRDLGATRLSLISLDSHPQIMPFYGLGQLTPEQLAALFPTRRPVTDDQLRLGRGAWQAFRAPDPAALEALLATDTSALPFLQGALTRHLEEFPSVEDGLARSERQILEVVDAGERTPGPLFRACIAREERPFMGDASFFDRVRTLSRGPHPLLQVAGRGDGAFTLPPDWSDTASFQAQELALTSTGCAVLAGEADWVGLTDIDRWLGGVHLHGQDAQWRWNRRDRRLVRSGE